MQKYLKKINLSLFNLYKKEDRLKITPRVFY